MLNELKNKEFVEPITEHRSRTTNDFKDSDLEFFSKVATERNVSRVALMDEAFSDFQKKVNCTADIDRMLAETSGYWVERDLAKVKTLMPTECKTMPAFKKAYLFLKLKDTADRKRVFNALKLDEDFDEVQETQKILDIASKRNQEGVLINYSIPSIANEIRSDLKPVAVEYLQLKLGQKALNIIRERTRDKFPKSNFEIASSMSPALETVLAVAQISKATWNALPDDLKAQIHKAVREGKTTLAKKLALQLDDNEESESSDEEKEN